MNLKNEVRRKNDIVDVIGEKIPLEKRGKNYFGVCPFHDDTNPSMSVSREKQIYTCFSCHATGNVFTFLMNYEHKEFNQVLNDLANRVGITLNGFKLKKQSTKYDEWYKIYDLANKYYQNNLTGTINLLLCMQKYNVKKIIFSSSATVYGTPKKLPITN